MPLFWGFGCVPFEAACWLCRAWGVWGWHGGAGAVLGKWGRSHPGPVRSVPLAVCPASVLLSGFWALPTPHFGLSSQTLPLWSSACAGHTAWWGLPTAHGLPGPLHLSPQPGVAAGNFGEAVTPWSGPALARPWAPDRALGVTPCGGLGRGVGCPLPWVPVCLSLPAAPGGRVRSARTGALSECGGAGGASGHCEDPRAARFPNRGHNSTEL